MIEEGPGPLAEPGVASVEGGHVVLDGPDGIAVTMTAHAARETGLSLIEAADKAQKEMAASP